MGRYNKYRNKKTVVDGITFMSEKEAWRYHELKMLEDSGDISNLRLQVKFDLLPTIRYNGETFRKRVYIADFVYIENGREIVEDVKGMRTPMYNIKKHMLLAKYPEINFIET